MKLCGFIANTTRKIFRTDLEFNVTTSLDSDLFLPDPEPSEISYTIISVDDHVVEPPHLFREYVQPQLRDLGPQLVETEQGHQVWEFEGNTYSQVGMNAVAGRKPETVSLEPFRFDQMRPGCYDIDARVKDMDLQILFCLLGNLLLESY